MEESFEHLDSATSSPINPSYNPSLPTELNAEDVAKMKGDAIGDTLYSERYVLSILLRLTTGAVDLAEDDNFEKDLCTLWDMTIEKDVVKLLLNHGVLDLFGMIIVTTEDKRLTEIIVGIIGNMSCFSETRDLISINDDLMTTVLNLIDTDDAPTLVQLMRFFKTTLIFENSGDEALWFRHFQTVDKFVEKFSFILSNSTSTTLLLNSLEALSAICNKFSVIEIQPPMNDVSGGGTNTKTTIFQDAYVKPCLVNGLIEAFIQTLPESLKDDKIVEVTSSPTEKNQKIMNLFMEINVLLCQYESVSQKCYQPFLTELFDCTAKVLNPLCQPINLFPLTSNTQDIIENVNELFQLLGDHFNVNCFTKLVTIWSHLVKYQEDHGDNDDDDGDNGEDHDEFWNTDDINSDDICMTILEYITRTTNKITDQNDLENSLKIIGRKTTEKLFRVISVGDSEPDIEKCCSKLENGLRKLWKFEENSN